MRPTRPRQRHRLQRFDRGDLTFEVSDGGPRDGTSAVLLHGWPGGADTWRRVAPALQDAGLRTLVPDQRGYSASARPPRRRDYAIHELVADVLALLDAAGLAAAHVVGHDWGGAVAWHLAAEHPDRVASLTVLSTPHPAAMAAALRCSDQAVRSAYVAAFQLPVIPERLLLAGDAALLRRVLRSSGLDAADADRYADRQLEPGALGASLAWYRALPFGGRPAGDVVVPTRYLWSSGDAALGRRAAELTERHVRGDYRFEVIEGASHWLPEQHPEVVVAAVAAQVQQGGGARPPGGPRSR